MKHRSLHLLAGLVCMSGLFVATASADDPVVNRTGADAPHQERNTTGNAANFRYGGPVPVTVTTTSDSVKATKKKQKVVEKKVVAKQKDKPVAKPAATVAPAPVKPTVVTEEPDDNIVGHDAPHQERGSDPEASAGRLIIWNR